MAHEDCFKVDQFKVDSPTRARLFYCCAHSHGDVVTSVFLPSCGGQDQMKVISFFDSSENFTSDIQLKTMLHFNE